MRQKVEIKWIICGGRNGTVSRGLTKARVWKVLDDLYQARVESGDEVSLTVVHGGAIWTDTWAGEWAKARGHEVDVMPIDEELDGVEWACGRNRNKRMLAAHKDAERCVGFPGGGGTNHMMSICQQAGMPVAEVELNKTSYRVYWWPLD